MAFTKGRGKTTGRQVGTPNKKTAARRQGIVGVGESPLEYFLSILRSKAPDDATPVQIVQREAMKFEAAKAAAPYCHARLAATEISTPEGKTIDVREVSSLELARRLAFLLSLAARTVDLV